MLKPLNPYQQIAATLFGYVLLMVMGILTARRATDDAFMIGEALVLASVPLAMSTVMWLSGRHTIDKLVDVCSANAPLWLAMSMLIARLLRV